MDIGRCNVLLICRRSSMAVVANLGPAIRAGKRDTSGLGTSDTGGLGCPSA